MFCHLQVPTGETKIKIKKGVTLIEAVIAIFVVAVVIVTFLKVLNAGISSTIEVSRRTSAVNTARAEIEYIKSQVYSASIGNMSQIYGFVNISEPNYPVDGNVSPVNGAKITALQQLTVKVTYIGSKSVSVTDYKAPRNSLSIIQNKTVTEPFSNVPVLPSGNGYYHVIQTASTGPIAVTWNFTAQPVLTANANVSNIFVRIYYGQPSWALNGTCTVNSSSLQNSINCSCSDSLQTVSCNTSNQLAGEYTILFFNGNASDTLFTYSSSKASYYR